MRKSMQLLAVAVVGASLGVAVVGCGSSASTNMDKMSSDKMTSDKKMSGDKMSSDKMSGDKMGGGNKMESDKGGM
jgi:pentapeptide MXKDX repeat protein